MYRSKNTVVGSCFNHAILDANSCIGAKLVFFYEQQVLIFLSKSYVMLLSKIHKLKLL